MNSTLLAQGQLLSSPLPLRERAARWFNGEDRVRGEAATPHPFASVDSLAMPSPARGEGANAGAQP
jgi:hypothetical protein